MFSLVKVKGIGANKLWKYLSQFKSNPTHSGEIRDEWTKFLIDHKGHVVDRFEPKDLP